MALIPKISAYVKSNCTKLVIKDITGVYDAVDNVGGYGTPNIEIGDVTGSSILITIPGSTTPITIINPVGLPTLDTTFEYEVSTSVLSPIPDGIYKIEYIINAGEETYTYGARYFFFICNVECCVFNIYSQIAQSTDCGCESNIIKNALYASTLLEGLKAAKDCGNITAVNNILNKLTDMCGLVSQDCGCSK